MKRRDDKVMIGSEIRELMKREGVTGYRISKETGIDETYVSKIIHNKVNPSYVTLKRILDVLGYQVCFEKNQERKEVKLFGKKLTRKG